MQIMHSFNLIHFTNDVYLLARLRPENVFLPPPPPLIKDFELAEVGSTTSGHTQHLILKHLICMKTVCNYLDSGDK